ncbi:hypothetical protein BKN38_02935 [Helicobacter sp. CLO-3]|uniref:RNA ligase n=1 Tax=unclassified Helicobacter TaxID=2593540 RepID=UPI0008051E4E|nr:MULTISPECIES: RNA ligase [unclassified Helicobacter]OBV29567.1 hypothetical protein BA723_05105 [Helicobacter sp. CLO-3]OHU84554.1 hypothetical protein BKN38_02935 [Helicobacter sp. CLO-3]
MRVLALMRGIPASGKSSWIKHLGLEEYAISPDTLRLLASAPIYLPESKIADDTSTLRAINQKNDKQVWKILFELLEMRMERGDFTIIDATHTSLNALRAYEGLASAYRYRLVVVDFSATPLEEAKKSNKSRGFKAVPEAVLESMHARLQELLQTPLPARYALVDAREVDSVNLDSANAESSTPSTNTSLANAPANPLIFTPQNLDKYRRIHHIGDIHGSFDALLDYLLLTGVIFDMPESSADSNAKSNSDSSPESSPNSNAESSPDSRAPKRREQAKRALYDSNFRQDICAQFLCKDEYYIFLGDYIDRGLQNAEVIAFLLGIMELPNVCLIEGNHERWLNIWHKQKSAQSQSASESQSEQPSKANSSKAEFFTFTAPDLARLNITHKDAGRIYAKLRQCAFYTFDGKRVLATHGGLPTLPPNLLLVATRQLIYGSGDYHDMRATARSFAQTTSEDTYQVFGHRNKEKAPMRVESRSFALEGGVEFGGCLRVAVLEKSAKNASAKNSENLAPVAPHLSISAHLSITPHLSRFLPFPPVPFKPNEPASFAKMPKPLAKSLESKANSADSAGSMDSAYLADSSALASINGRICALSAKNDGFIEVYMQNRSNLAAIERHKEARKVFGLIAKLRESPLIKEREFGRISSFNFTKQAFFDRRWDSLTCKARGLFIDTAESKIIARSYDKFFNLDEREDTKLSALKDRFSYPVDVYAKENGFLVIVSAGVANIDNGSIDSAPNSAGMLDNSELFITSKSDPTSPFAQIAHEIIHATLREQEKSQNLAPGTLAKRLSATLRARDISLVFEVIDPARDPHIIAYEKPCVIALDAIKNSLAFEKLPYEDLQELCAEFGFAFKARVARLRNWREFEEFIAKNARLGENVESSAESKNADSAKIDSIKLVSDTRTESSAESDFLDSSLLDSGVVLDSSAKSSALRDDAFLRSSGARQNGALEGFVFEDSAGFMLKYKGAYYRMWKALRGVVEQCARLQMPVQIPHDKNTADKAKNTSDTQSTKSNVDSASKLDDDTNNINSAINANNQSTINLGKAHKSKGAPLPHFLRGNAFVLEFCKWLNDYIDTHGINALESTSIITLREKFLHKIPPGKIAQIAAPKA